jgi:hypothetical protein
LNFRPASRIQSTVDFRENVSPIFSQQCSIWMKDWICFCVPIFLFVFLRKKSIKNLLSFLIIDSLIKLIND